MTEVPEHLLQRSRERRAALGLGGGDEGAQPSTEVAPKAAAEPAAAGAPPAEAEPIEVEPEPEPEPAIPVPRARVPVWAMPVLVLLPFWAIIYSGAFGDREEAAAPSPGAKVYQAAGCGSCHGANGQGTGQAPALAAVTETFPEFQDHVDWVTEGSASVRGQRYGATNNGPATGGMPSFGDSLTEQEIILVVCHERTTFAGEEPPEECAETPAASEGGESADG